MSRRTKRMPGQALRHRIIRQTRGQAGTWERYLQPGSEIKTPSLYMSITATLSNRQPLILASEIGRRGEGIRGFLSRKRRAAWKAGSRVDFSTAVWSGKRQASIWTFPI